tara:strand:- start:56 stop:550 length:495 start_codon:yes stop_codon:yes gene_type:complete
VYHEKVKTSRVYVRDATIVNPLALMLFGGKMVVDHVASRAILDNWLRFDVAAQHAVLINAMREKLMEIMARKIQNTRLDLHDDPDAKRVTDALCTLVGSPGGGGGGSGGGSGGGGGHGKQSRKLTPRGAQGASAGQQQDWRCPACQASNFASRQKCYKCAKPRP